MVIGNSSAKKICLCVFICVPRVICTRVTAGPLPGCYRQAAAVLVGWITNRACCQCNSPCLGFLTSSSRWWLSIVGIHFYLFFFILMISETCLRIKVYVDMMRWDFFLFWWQVIDLRSVGLTGDFPEHMLVGVAVQLRFRRSKDVVTLRLTRNLRSDCYGFPIFFWVEAK